MVTRGRTEQHLLVLVTLALTALGLVMVFSATSASAALSDGDAMSYLIRQSLYACAGVVFLVILSRFDYHRLRQLAPVFLVATLVLCFGVLVAAPAVNGARRWFALGPISLQPSELAKLALCIWVAARLAHRPAPRTLGDLVKPIGIVTGIFCGAIVLEPDLGTTIAIALMVGGILLVSGVPARLFGLATVLALGVGAAAIWAEPYRRARFFSFLNPTADPQGAGYQLQQAIIGVGSGRIPGVGLGHGPQSSFYLPEAHTDMIAATVGEELGLIGLALLVAAFLVFAWAGFRVALTCRDPFGKRLAAGITTLVCGQAVVNLAAVLGIAPLTGIPLPFVSYGGSSLIMLLTAVGVLLNIAGNERVVQARVRDRGRRNSGARAAGARSRGSASRARRERDVRRVPGSRRVAAGS